MSDSLPVEAVPSGTVVIARDGESGLEILMLRRKPSERDHFSGMWVFPGGKVDPEDIGEGELELARVAAVRESMEEAGVALRSEALLPLDRWEPQPREGLGVRRFSTWVFLTASAGGAESDAIQVDGVEIDQYRWISPADALAAHSSEEMGFVGPTWMTLYKLSHLDSVASALTWAEQRESIKYFSKVHFGDATTPTVITWQGDELYDETTNGRHRLTMTPGNWTFEES